MFVTAPKISRIGIIFIIFVFIILLSFAGLYYFLEQRNLALQSSPIELLISKSYPFEEEGVRGEVVVEKVVSRTCTHSSGYQLSIACFGETKVYWQMNSPNFNANKMTT